MPNHVFSEVPHVTIPRSSFDRSHQRKSTLDDAGVLYPILVDEVLPGDTFKIRAKHFVRVSTLIAPIMDNLYFDTFYFFVPERLVWKNFQKMCGEQENPGDSTDFTFPCFYTVIEAVGKGVKAPPPIDAPVLNTDLIPDCDYGSLADHFGIPPQVGYIDYVRAEPFRAYNLIWNEWFRDENLQESVPVVKDDIDRISNYHLLRRGKRKDYFTSGLPWPVKDGTGVELPIHGTADITGLDLVYGDVMSVNHNTGEIGSFVNGVSGGNSPLYTLGADIDLNIRMNEGLIKAVGDDPPHVNLSNAVTTTINEFREAFQVQRWLERCARSGTRYTEILRGMFGVVSPDARLQRPEYLGGTSSPIDVNVVPQTSGTGSSPQANLAAFAVGISHNGDGFTKSFVEHGWIIGLCCIRSDNTYQQGINRMWTRRTKFDMYWPTLAHLGEQAILNKEIFVTGIDTSQNQDGSLRTNIDDQINNQVFAYQERYAEYRYYPNMITGKFRSNYSASLDFWHLSQKFENLPVLNEEFIVENPPVDRIVAVIDEPKFLLDSYFEMNCVRPMPLYSVPGLVDHF